MEEEEKTNVHIKQDYEMLQTNQSDLACSMNDNEIVKVKLQILDRPEGPHIHISLCHPHCRIAIYVDCIIT